MSLTPVNLPLFPDGCGGCGPACCRSIEFVHAGRPPMNHKEEALLFAVCSESLRKTIEQATGPECCMLTPDGLCKLELIYHAMPGACRNFAVGGPDCLSAREKMKVSCGR